QEDRGRRRIVHRSLNQILHIGTVNLQLGAVLPKPFRGNFASYLGMPLHSPTWQASRFPYMVWAIHTPGKNGHAFVIGPYFVIVPDEHADPLADVLENRIRGGFPCNVEPD